MVARQVSRSIEDVKNRNKDRRTAVHPQPSTLNPQPYTLKPEP